MTLFGFSQNDGVKITKENKKRIQAELKAYMKNPQMYIEEQDLQKSKMKGANDELEMLRKQQSEHAGLLVHLSDSIAALNNEKQQILEAMNAAKVDSSNIPVISESTGETVAATIKEDLPTKKGETIKVERTSAKVVEPIKIERPTANSEAGKTASIPSKTAEPAKTIEPAKLAAPIAKAPEPAKPAVKSIAKSTEPNRIVVPTGRPDEPARAASHTPKASAPSNSGAKTYKIQLGTFATFNPSAFSGDKTLMTEKVDATGANKLMIGNFTNEEEARKVAADFKKMGITGAFIVNYSNGVRAK